MNMDELVKNMREYLLDVYDMQQWVCDPC